MAVSYKKLWKLLADKDMKKKGLCEKAGISPVSATKMGCGGYITTEILLKSVLCWIVGLKILWKLCQIRTNLILPMHFDAQDSDK